MSCWNIPEKKTTKTTKKKLALLLQTGKPCSAWLVSQFLFYHKLLYKITNTSDVAMATWYLKRAPDQLATIKTLKWLQIVGYKCCLRGYSCALSSSFSMNICEIYMHVNTFDMEEVEEEEGWALPCLSSCL